TRRHGRNPAKHRWRGGSLGTCRHVVELRDREVLRASEAGSGAPMTNRLTVQLRDSGEFHPWFAVVPWDEGDLLGLYRVGRSVLLIVFRCKPRHNRVCTTASENRVVVATDRYFLNQKIMPAPSARTTTPRMNPERSERMSVMSPNWLLKAYPNVP